MNSQIHDLHELHRLQQLLAGILTTMPAGRLDRDLLQRQLRAVNITLYECHPVSGGFALLLGTSAKTWLGRLAMSDGQLHLTLLTELTAEVDPYEVILFYAAQVVLWHGRPGVEDGWLADIVNAHIVRVRSVDADQGIVHYAVLSDDDHKSCMRIPGWLVLHHAAALDGATAVLAAMSRDLLDPEWVLRRYGYPEACCVRCTSCFDCFTVEIGAYRYHLDLRDETITCIEAVD